MAARKKMQKVAIEVQGSGIVTLLLTAEDKDTIYLNGRWKHLSRGKDDDIYELLPEVLGTDSKGIFNSEGKFTRQNGSKELVILRTPITLLDVDTMHGLSWGGQGKVRIRNLGTHQWKAY